MWRSLLLVSFVCSLALNGYLFLQLQNSDKASLVFGVSFFDEQKSQSVKSVKQPIEQSAKKQLPALTLTEKAGDNRPVDLIKKINQALENNDYSLASFLMTELAAQAPEHVSAFKNLWLLKAQQFIDLKEYQFAEQVIESFLHYSADDFAFLLLSVDWYLAQQQYFLAIKQAYEIQYHSIDFQQQQQALALTDKLIDQEIARLIDRKLWRELYRFSEQVSLLIVDNLAVQWALAQAYFHLEQFEQAENVLLLLIEQENFSLAAQSLLTQTQLALRKPMMVPLLKQGEHFIVEGSINNQTSVRLLLDTGASISLLSQTVFDDLQLMVGAEYMQEITLNTAGGEVVADLYKFAQFDLHGYVVENILFAVSNEVISGSDGLLGMNYLKHFDFYIDQNNHLLRLTNK